MQRKYKEGTIHEAKWYAMGANKGHGERMSNVDKRHAVTMALEDEELSKRPNIEIAEQCKVSEHLVRILRNERYSTRSQQNIQINEIRKPQNIDEIIAERVQEELAKRPEQPPDEEIERLRRELAGQEEARLEQEEQARRIEDEMEALKNGDHPDIEAIVEERVQKAIAEAGHPDQNGETERRLSEQQERHAEEIRKLHEEMEALRSTGPEIVEKEVPSQELEEALRQKETEQVNLQNQLDAKIREIEEAGNAGMEVSELSGQKDNLVSEIGSLKNDLAEAYRENARARFRDAGAGTDAILRATEFFSARLQDADFCKLAARDIVMEIVAFREDMERVRSAADAVLEASDQLLFQIRDDGATDIS